MKKWLCALYVIGLLLLGINSLLYMYAENKGERGNACEVNYKKAGKFDVSTSV